MTNGNPNVFDVLNNLNSLISVYAYNRIQNTFTYTRTYGQTTNYYNMYLVPINAGSFMGFTNNTKNLISSSGTQSTSPINVNTIQAISLQDRANQRRTKFKGHVSIPP